MDETSGVIDKAVEHGWKRVKGLVDEADKCGYKFYSSRYQRGEIEFKMSDGVTLGKSVTLTYREWFRERGLRFMQRDGLAIKRYIDKRIKTLGIAQDKGLTALRGET